MKQVYYDAFISGLVPVKVIRPAGAADFEFPCSHRNQFVVEVTRSVKAYDRGEQLIVSRNSLVHKSRVSNGQQLVVQAQL